MRFLLELWIWAHILLALGVVALIYALFASYIGDWRPRSVLRLLNWKKPR